MLSNNNNKEVIHYISHSIDKALSTFTDCIDGLMHSNVFMSSTRLFAQSSYGRCSSCPHSFIRIRECGCVCCGWVLWCVLNSWRVQMITVQSQKQHSMLGQSWRKQQKAKLPTRYECIGKRVEYVCWTMDRELRSSPSCFVVVQTRRRNKSLFAHGSCSQVLHLSSPLLPLAARPKS